MAKLHSKYLFPFSIEYAYLWKIDYTGKGYWNLRDLRFTQEADNGTEYDFLIYLFYNPFRNFQVQLGYRSLHVEAKSGLDLKSGVKNADLDKAESSSAGWLLRARAKISSQNWRPDSDQIFSIRNRKTTGIAGLFRGFCG